VLIFDDNGVRSHAICRCCGEKFAARASIGTGSLNRHMSTCRKKLANDRKVQSKLAMNVMGCITRLMTLLVLVMNCAG
jgi:hypothetical protein